jgi:KaiC/GvpD/RAD55 family RecA-like ATPase
LYTNPEERRTNTLKLVSALKGWKATCMISSEDVPGSEHSFPHTVSGVESFADGFIHLSFMRQESRRNRAVEIIKMRGCRHEHEIRPASIQEKGFVVSSPEAEKKKEGRKKRQLPEL